MATFDRRLGARVKSLREIADMSQEQLAKLLKVKRVTVSQIESGARKLSAEDTAALAKIFNTSSDVLLDLGSDIEVILERGDETKKKVTRSEDVRVSVPQKNVRKFKEVLLYILNDVGSRPNIGQTVIYKLLYFIDFNYYEKFEDQLIGATYQKNHYGPTPVEFAKIVQEMEGRDLVKLEEKYFKYPRTKYIPLREPDLSCLSAPELDMINEVLERLGHMNAKEISDYSHEDIPWQTTEDGQIIDYEAVFYRAAPYSVRSYEEDDAV